MTIVTTAEAGDELRVKSTDKDKADPKEATTIRESLSTLPAVEVVAASDPPLSRAYLPHASLIGWLNDQELLVMVDQFLATYNIATSTLSKSGIKIKDAHHAYVR
jgi:hypothetical protein